VAGASDGFYDEDDTTCASLLAQFNATFNVDVMQGILQKAARCSWYGDGLAALQNQQEFYQQQNQQQ
jgi:hypothetical protein